MLEGFDTGVITRSLNYLFVDGMTFTIKLTLMAMVGGLVAGTGLALMRLSGNAAVRNIASAYVNLVRAVPLVLVIFWFYFLVPYIGAWLTGAQNPIQVGAFTSSLTTFVMFEAAYYCEIMRAGILSVPRGQFYAARALGMRETQIMALIVIPQAVRNMLPVLLTQTIILFQDVSLVYVISITDFVGAASNVAQRDGRPIEMYVFVAAVYFVISFGLSRVVGRLQRRIQIVR
ncbi:ABC transporter permease subunit [Pandoraea fibrosis]|uniref:ABC transporter permease subunit n=1 Tax=Pandoraea fibrosis TaxID=1891094 RepID=A0ABX6HVJ5_9BURK|nr:amino acid ABC transporter permease [Pandoraea fibrosis]QHE91511.1 ABC transporter permease subunit [Pandoraea fibrosis]QHF14931.1 ABC transporter permease subunit [Pandoraea fibrosis]